MTDIQIKTEQYKTITLKRYKTSYELIDIQILDYINLGDDKYYVEVNIIGYADVEVAYLLNKAFKADIFNLYSTQVNDINIINPNFRTKEEIIINIQKSKNVFNGYSFESEDKIKWLITYIKAILAKNMIKSY